MNHRDCPKACTHSDDALTRAKTAGLRITKGLKAVIALLHENHCQMSTAEIHSHLNASGESSGLPTVYRICDNLAEAGVLARQFAQDGSLRYCLCLHSDTHHHHFICAQCGRVFELEGCPIESWSAELQKKQGLHIESHVLELRGLCRTCHQARRTISPCSGTGKVSAATF